MLLPVSAEAKDKLKKDGDNITKELFIFSVSANPGGRGRVKMKK